MDTFLSTITENITGTNISIFVALATAIFAYSSLRQNAKTQKSIFLWELMKEESRLSCLISEKSKKCDYTEPYLNFYDALGTLYISGQVSREDIDLYFRDMIICAFDLFKDEIYKIREKEKDRDSYKNFEKLYQEIMENKKEASKTKNITNKIIAGVESYTPYIALVLGIPFGFIVILLSTSQNNTSLIDNIKTLNIIVTSFIILSATLAMLSFTYYNNMTNRNDKSSKTIFRIAETEFYATILYGMLLITGTILIATNQSINKIITYSLSIISIFTAIFGSGLLTLGIIMSIIVMFKSLIHKRTTQNTP